MAESKPVQQPPLKLNKKLYTDITRLKLLDTDGAEVRFRLKTSPFNGDEEEIACKEREEYTITGQIFPKSKPFDEGSYMIEIKLTKTFPVDPPEIRFLTPIYHPNVGKDGKFCNELLQKTHKWTPNTSLVEALKSVVEHIDKPDVNFALSVG